MLVADYLIALLALGSPTTTEGRAELLLYADIMASYADRLCGLNRRPVRSIDWMPEDGEYNPIGWSRAYWFVDFTDIRIRRVYWVTHGYKEHMLLMAHELGHSWFGWDHVEPPALMAAVLDSTLSLSYAIGVAYGAECLRQGKTIDFTVLLEGL